MAGSCKLKDTEEVRSLLKKLEDMASMGEEGERDVAKDKLRKIASKYGIDPDNGKYISQKYFSYSKGKDYLAILTHCIYDTKHDAKIFEVSSPRNTIVVDLENVEYIEVCEKINHYWTEYSKEKDSLVIAFILKNKIGIAEGEVKGTIDVERVARLKGVIEDNNYTKKINA